MNGSNQLRELGYVEGQNIEFEFRSAEGVGTSRSCQKETSEDTSAPLKGNVSRDWP
jgi:hypothetical protein